MSIPKIPKQIEEAIKRKPLPKAFFDRLPQEARRFAFTVKGIESVRVLEQTLNSLEKARKAGDTFQVWKQNYDPELFINNSHMSSVYRTHMNTQMNSGIYLKATEESADKPYLMYSAVLDDRTRETHRALHGIIRPVDDKFWNTNMPPNGYNCRCTVIQLSVAQADLRRRALRNAQNKILKENGKPLLPSSRSISTSIAEIEHLRKELGAKPDAGFDSPFKNDTTNGISKYAEKVKKGIPSGIKPAILIVLSTKEREKDVSQYYDDIEDDLIDLRKKNERKKNP
jgi:SPP1 gp7 family putative phage head morphogenesis protein